MTACGGGAIFRIVGSRESDATRILRAINAKGGSSWEAHTDTVGVR